MAKGIEILARGLWLANGRILLCRNVAKGYFYLPGGHVEFSETAPEALAREFAEETGQSVRIGRGLAIAECVFDQGGKRRHEINLVFLVEHQGEPPAIRSRESEIDFEWVGESSIPEVDLRPSIIRQWLIEADVHELARAGAPVAWLRDA